MQVELAQLEYTLPRLTRMWTHLEKFRGGIGVRGPGETQLESDRRLIQVRIKLLKERLADVQRARDVQRQSRRGEFRASLVGYTNVGKSSILRSLSGADDIFVENRLFATLDPLTRDVELGDHGHVLLTDTVGFIRKLPHALVEAFKATLEETVLADLILHVVDAAAPEERRLADMQAVDAVLEEIGVGEKPRLLVLNKADLLDEGARHEAALRHGGAALVSALSGEGLDDLRAAIEAAFEDTLADVELLVPYSQGARLHELHELAGDLERIERGDGVLVHARLPVAELHRFDDLTVV
jgi:GTP-binding protein HflX